MTNISVGTRWEAIEKIGSLKDTVVISINNNHDEEAEILNLQTDHTVFVQTFIFSVMEMNRSDAFRIRQWVEYANEMDYDLHIHCSSATVRSVGVMMAANKIINGVEPYGENKICERVLATVGENEFCGVESVQTEDTPNQPSKFAPVGVTIVVNLDGQNLKAERTCIVSAKTDDQTYFIKDTGKEHKGKLWWGYP